MKKMLFFSVMFLMGLATSFAQVPLNEQLTYQTVVRNAQNQLVYNQSNVSVTVYVCNLNATVVRYSETHTGLSTNPNGLLTLMVGGGTPATGSWNDIIWTDASIYTVISYNPGTGTVTITSDPAPVNAVPYALSAHVDCSVVVGCVDDAIENPTSTTNNAIDTVIENHLTPYEIKNCGDVTDCVDNAIADGSSTTNHAIDTVVSNIVYDSLVPYTIKNCDNVIACVDNAIADGTSTTNHAIDTVVAHSIHDSLVAHPVYNSTITFHQEGETDQSITLNQSTNQTINIVTFSQKSARFIATAGLIDFALTVPSGKTLDATDHLVQMYINGVYVGDTVDGVVKMSGTTAKYQPGSNGGYTLANDDRVNFVFWVK